MVNRTMFDLYHSPRVVGAIPTKDINKNIRLNIKNIARENLPGVKRHYALPENSFKKDVRTVFDNAKAESDTIANSAERNPRAGIVDGKNANRNYRKFIKKHSPGTLNSQEAHRAFNDVTLHHENNELVKSKDFRKALHGSATKPAQVTAFASHLHPDVVLREHNVLSTLSGGSPETIDAVKKTFSNMRTATGEKDVLDAFIPGGYGTGNRLSRHARKRISESMISKSNF